ncbi:MAG TPA: rhomboid family intramembrane serine protease, partial [Verrucomicrobiae bacterium]
MWLIVAENMAPVPPEPLPATAEIVAYSRRQAMDWALVLASQGIEAIIDRAPDRERRWLLLIPPQDLARARDAIRLYRAENRGWSWRKELPGADLELHWGAIVFCVVLALIHSLSVYQLPFIEDRGMMDSLKVHDGQWWRLFTAVFLHADLAHLASNVTFGIIVLGLAMGRFGAGLALLSTLLAGAIGNLGGQFLYSGIHQGLGASGMMMGALGMIAVHSISLLKTNPKAARYIISGLAGGMFMFMLFGVGSDPKTDLVAHAVGFIAGILFGAILALAPQKIVRSHLADRLALF